MAIYLFLLLFNILIFHYIKYMTKEFKSYKLLSLINLGSALIFSLFSISFHADISLVAFPLAIIYTAITAYFVLYKIIIKNDGSKFYLAIKLTEYLPYFLFITFILRRAGNEGTPFFIDLITVISWFVMFALSYLSSRKLYPVRNENVVKGWAVAPSNMKFKGIAKIIFEIADWIDAIVWAIFTVLIFQIFIMQLYAIPSESMVPTFLVKDHVFVSKIDCGPKFPLTDVGLPTFRDYKRGDTIVLRNPHYSHDRKSEVKTVTNQLIYMLTIMQINLNKDENGEQMADPLVKRITGLPGEQLVMQDGTLYRRTKDSDIFEPVEIDNKYATWNLNNVNPKIKNQIQYFPFSNEEYNIMLDLEEERRNLDLTVAEYEANELARRFSKLAFKNDLSGDFEFTSLYEMDLFRKSTEITRNLMCQNGGVEWFTDFMTSWIPAKNNSRDMYEEANFRLNVMTKLTFGKIIVRYAELYSSGVSSSNWANDTELMEACNSAEVLNWYIQGLLDERNMPVFPANDKDGNPQYIPSKCYFMMGDNRFNSLDLRHRYDRKMESLTKDDPKSVTYLSMMEPQYINKKYIIGKPIFRFWPLNRFGKV